MPFFEPEPDPDAPHVRPAPDAPIFLVGFMASGKTTIGKLVAGRLGWTFLDLDEMIARAAGVAIPEIFAREGESGFRQREAAAVREAGMLRQTVIATGGGAACRDENLNTMLAVGSVVALGVSPEEAVRRAGGASGRPLLDGQSDPVAAARGLLERRAPFYARAHVRLETEGRTPDQLAGELLRTLGLRAAVNGGGQ
jgi:shikimate kinase